MDLGLRSKGLDMRKQEKWERMKLEPGIQNRGTKQGGNKTGGQNRGTKQENKTGKQNKRTRRTSFTISTFKSS
jgi:hypothetical protein